MGNFVVATSRKMSGEQRDSMEKGWWYKIKNIFGRGSNSNLHSKMFATVYLSAVIPRKYMQTQIQDLNQRYLYWSWLCCPYKNYKKEQKQHKIKEIHICTLQCLSQSLIIGYDVKSKTKIYDQSTFSMV